MNNKNMFLFVLLTICFDQAINYIPILFLKSLFLGIVLRNRDGFFSI